MLKNKWALKIGRRTATHTVEVPQWFGTAQQYFHLPVEEGCRIAGIRRSHLWVQTNQDQSHKYEGKACKELWNEHETGKIKLGEYWCATLILNQWFSYTASFFSPGCDSQSPRNWVWAAATCWVSRLGKSQILVWLKSVLIVHLS